MDGNEYEAIEKLAYRFWEERGRPLGSPEVDWQHAEEELETQRYPLRPMMSVALGPAWSE
jgi:hypothetical protein